MNKMHLKTSLAVAAAAFLVATGASAASPNGDTWAKTPSTGNPSAMTPSTSDNSMMNKSGSSMMDKSGSYANSMPNRNETSTEAFGKLDAAHKGYVTPDEASKLKGFDFGYADTNKDGKLSQSEFDAAWANYIHNK